MHQSAGILGIAPDHRRQGIEGVEQKMRVDLRLQQLDLRLGQQPLLLVVLAGQDLAGEQPGYPFPRVRLMEEKNLRLGS